jgi:hypothetical protein
MKRVYNRIPPMHMTKPRRALFLISLFSALGAVACGIAIKKDLSKVPQGQVGFDDLCGLQEYFDSLEAHVASEPQLETALDLEGGDGVKTIRGGKARLAFQGSFLLKNLRRVLNDNWQRLPESLATAEKVEIEVRWAERAGVKRVVTDQPAELIINNDSYDLPYHVCLSELLYGAPLYKQRQLLWGLPNPSASRPIPILTEDGGVDAGAVIQSTDAGAPTSAAPASTSPKPAPPAAPPAAH